MLSTYSLQTHVKVDAPSLSTLTRPTMFVIVVRTQLELAMEIVSISILTQLEFAFSASIQIAIWSLTNFNAPPLALEPQWM